MFSAAISATRRSLGVQRLEAGEHQSPRPRPRRRELRLGLAFERRRPELVRELEPLAQVVARVRTPVPAAERRTELDERLRVLEPRVGAREDVYLLYVLLAPSVVISLFGMVNTLVLSVYERTRERARGRAQTAPPPPLGRSGT
jgi:hypothetical protein